MDGNVELNRFFVDCFNEILRMEEQKLCSIANNRLSMNEIHVIESINRAKQEGDNSAGKVAKLLNITMGSLTVSVSGLIKKGYVIKTKDINDKRIAKIELTELGNFINGRHEEFHKKMIDDIVLNLNKAEENALINALDKLRLYFRKKTDD
jgi:DNA-binding MarR family transcriptional regulator